MTEQELLLLSSREQDALIHEWVMGGKRYPPEMWDRVSMENDGNGVITTRPVLPHYTEGMAAAWQVVEKMSQIGFIMDMTVYSGGDADVRFIRGETQGIGALRKVPEAIYIAALRAVGAIS
jgi:hypothetical protein